MATQHKAAVTKAAPAPARSTVEDKTADRSAEKPVEPVSQSGGPGEADGKPNSPYTPIPNDQQKS